ncbi:MAG: hypothetical protein NT004_06320 [Bacteroidetes bacterium]|nr:hypothetical protein [Bacteroidota bacterium]
MSKNRAISIRQLYSTTIRSLDFAGEWLDAIGCPEPAGTWLIWGNSGNGKTRFALQLAKYLATFGRRVAYNSLEEGVSLSLRNAIEDCNMQEVARRFVLLDKEHVPDLIERLNKKRSPDVVIIDSIQYTGLTYADYKSLKDRFRSKLFILVSHAEGSHPSGRVARSIRFDANVKIWVEGYQAYPSSRYGGGTPYVIWDKGASDLVTPKNNEQ